jgi:hypothetical protein
MHERHQWNGRETDSGLHVTYTYYVYAAAKKKAVAWSIEHPDTRVTVTRDERPYAAFLNGIEVSLCRDDFNIGQ